MCKICLITPHPIHNPSLRHRLCHSPMTEKWTRGLWGQSSEMRWSTWQTYNDYRSCYYWSQGHMLSKTCQHKLTLILTGNKKKWYTCKGITAVGRCAITWCCFSEILPRKVMACCYFCGQLVGKSWHCVWWNVFEYNCCNSFAISPTKHGLI